MVIPSELILSSVQVQTPIAREECVVRYGHIGFLLITRYNSDLKGYSMEMII